MGFVVYRQLWDYLSLDDIVGPISLQKVFSTVVVAVAFVVVIPSVQFKRFFCFSNTFFFCRVWCRSCDMCLLLLVLVLGCVFFLC